MNNSRRKFLQTGGLLATGALLSSNKLFAEASSHKLKKFGIQLWSVRDDMAKDPSSVLQQLASYGYKQIESCDLDKGIFWGMKNTDFKKRLDDLGLDCTSAHTDAYSNDFEKKVDECAAIGLKYIIHAWEGPDKTISDYKKMAEDFNKKGELCHKAGMKFAFHNHAFTFQLLENQYAQDVLMENTNPDYVSFEMDMYWVVTAGQDPVAWLKKYNNRFKLCHVKDRSKTAAATDHDASCNLGTGKIDFATLLPVARKCGMDYFYVEQEKWDGSTPMLSAEADAAYMKKVRV